MMHRIVCAIVCGGQFIPDTVEESKTLAAVKEVDKGVYIGLIISQAKEMVERIITKAVEKDRVTLELNLWG